MKRSYRRHRNPKKPEKNEQPFFSKTSDQTKQGSFFQARLKVGKPGDKFEQEADATAQAVVNQSSDQALHQKEKDSIQRVTLATPAEDEKLGTAEARMEKDKYIQEKTDIQTMGEKKEEAPEVQEMDQPQEEEAPQVQSMETEEDTEVKEKAAPHVQSMGDTEEERDPVQRLEEEKPELQSQAEEKEETEVQTKKNAATSTAPDNISRRIKRSKGKGKSLPAKTQEEMESAFGADLSDVVIHTDPEAQDLNQRLGAQAFTQGQDIYFNTDKYHPETASGKQLIAHELTHVIQQKGKKKKK